MNRGKNLEEVRGDAVFSGNANGQPRIMRKRLINMTTRALITLSRSDSPHGLARSSQSIGPHTCTHTYTYFLPLSPLSPLTYSLTHSPTHSCTHSHITLFLDLSFSFSFSICLPPMYTLISHIKTTLYTLILSYIHTLTHTQNC